MVMNSSYPSPVEVPDAACITALAAASCVDVRVLNAKPFRQLTPQGRFDQRLALVRFNVNTTVDCWALVSVAKNAFAKHTTLATPVSDEQLEVVVIVVVVVVVVELAEVSVFFLQANTITVVTIAAETLQMIFR